MRNKPMRIFEITNPKLKSQIMRAIDNMPDDAPEVDNILQYIKGTLHQDNLDKFLEQSDIKYRITDARAYNFFKTSLENLKLPLEQKINMLVLMKDRKNLISKDVFISNNEGSMLEDNGGIGEKLKNNKVFQALSSPIWSFTIGGQGGMGPGELFLALFSGGSLQANKKGKDAQGGDVNIDGWAVEVKSGGVVSTHKGKYVIVDSLNSELKSLASQAGLTEKYPKFAILLNSRKKGSGTSFESGWLPLFFKLYTDERGEAESLNVFSQYMKRLYEGISQDIIADMFENLGSSKATALLAPYIFNECQKAYKWNSVFVAGPNLSYCNLVTFEELPSGLRYTVKLKRGQDSNATADGYMVVSYGEEAPTGDQDNQINLSLDDIKDNTRQLKKGTERYPKKDINARNKEEPTRNIKAERNRLEAEIDDQFLQKLQDPDNPFTQAWRKYRGDKVAAKEEMLTLIKAGKTDKELAQDLENNIYETEILRIKKLIG